MFRVIYKYIRENCLFLINIFCFQDQKLSNQPIKKIISGLINGINMVVPSNKSLSLLWLPFIMHLLHDRDWYVIIFTSHSKWGSYYRNLKTLCQSFHGWETLDEWTQNLKLGLLDSSLCYLPICKWFVRAFFSSLLKVNSIHKFNNKNFAAIPSEENCCLPF